MSLTLATAQTEVSDDLPRNLAQAHAALEAAAGCGADLLHFPEGSLSGYSKVHMGAWGAYDWDVLRRGKLELLAAAARLGLHVVFGAYHPLGTEPPHNSLFVGTPDGAILDRYDKRFCSHAEMDALFTPGRDFVQVTVGGLRVAFAMCIEIQFPVLFEEAFQHETDLLLLSTCSDDPMFPIQARALARTYGFWVSFANDAGRGAGSPSMLVGPDGAVLGACEPGAPGVVVQALDPADPRWDVPLRRARPWRRRAREPGYYEPRWSAHPRSRDRTQL